MTVPYIDTYDRDYCREKLIPVSAEVLAAARKLGAENDELIK